MNAVCGRLQLRDDLRARADTEGWNALIAQHGTPLLVLDPDRVAAQYSLLGVAPAWLPVCTTR